jgi:hypothetical protein
MKRRSWLVLVWLVTIVLLFISCAQNVPTAQTEVETETVTGVAQPTTEPKAGTESTTTVAPPTHEPIPANFSVSDLTITPKEVMVDSPVTIEVLVTNTGELSGSCDITLKIDETAEATEKITLEGGASQRVTFTMTKSTMKTYSVGINGQSGTFVVEPPPLIDMGAFMRGIYFNNLVPFDPSQLPPDAPPGAQPPPPRRLYTPPEADQNLKNLALTGANWIAISLRWGQETISSTKISRSEYATATDAELRHVIDLAHSLGIRVLLMPMVHLSNDPTHGHIYIGSTFNSENQWQEWFASYREFINYYATFSQEAEVDMLFIGNELGATTHREADWRRVISEVRPITYDSLCVGPFPMGEYLRIKWWDAVDYIGVGGYFPLTDKNDPTIEELKAAWIDKGYLAELENLSKEFNKPLIISEIGYPSIDGVNRIPGSSPFNKTQDIQEQADCYQAAFEVLWGKPWLKGMFWFYWPSNPQVGPADTYYTPYGKPAEEVLKKYYLSQ